MYKIIATAVIVLVVVVGPTLAGKCDLMQDYKKDEKMKQTIADMGEWGGNKCKDGLTDDDMGLAEKCYSTHVQPEVNKLKTGKIVDDFLIQKVLKRDNIKDICSKDEKVAKAVAEAIKKEAMKDIGMKAGMGMKKEVEAECDPIKAALAGTIACIKGA